MKLKIRMVNLRDNKIGKLVNKPIKLFKKKFKKDLERKILLPENEGLSYEIVDLIEPYGFEVIVKGSNNLLKREWKEMDEEYNTATNSKKGEAGLMALTAIGISFTYWLEDEKTGKSLKSFKI